MFSSDALTASFSAWLMSPESIFFARSASSWRALPNSPLESASVSFAVSPSVDLSSERSRLSASLVRALSPLRTSSSFFCTSDMRRIASRRSSLDSPGSPPTFGSAFLARPFIASFTSWGSAFEPSISFWTRSSESSTSCFSVSATGVDGSSSAGHS